MREFFIIFIILGEMFYGIFAYLCAAITIVLWLVLFFALCVPAYYIFGTQKPRDWITVAYRIIFDLLGMREKQ